MRTRGGRPVATTGGCDPVHNRHANVDDEHVGTEGASRFDGSTAVLGLAEHVDATPLEQRSEAAPDEVLVVGEYDARHCRSGAGSSPRGETRPRRGLVR